MARRRVSSKTFGQVKESSKQDSKISSSVTPRFKKGEVITVQIKKHRLEQESPSAGASSNGDELVLRSQTESEHDQVPVLQNLKPSTPLSINEANSIIIGQIKAENGAIQPRVKQQPKEEDFYEPRTEP
jgi:hypothetical protein